MSPGAGPGRMSDYTPLEKLLHRMVLGVPAIAETAFAADQALARPDAAAARNGRHVFVAGLARAGTTILTRRIHASGAFASLTYRDMPFVLAPNLWQRLGGGSDRALDTQERAHGDGLIVGIDSPESLEEPFWRVFDGPAYIGHDRLHPHMPDAALCAKYAGFVGAILKAAGGTRYLAKNNNNILRLAMLAETFPEAEILVPFRAPGAHAGSLLSQHRRFVERHAADRFSRAYMGWLVHHEFGADHRPFAAPAPATADPMARDYWLAQWCAVYGGLIDTAPRTARFVCYEDLCGDPGTWAGLAAALNIPAEGGEAFRTPPAPPALPETAREAGAQALYARLRDRARAAPV
ncbi:hypothetical protein Ga0609869_003459 [Rhodovulum iodosum]|uniref:Sulfotransferase family protein n=2 Tax=Rhodovulum iodosum TaxID=68291 RepID=A0ABV3XXM2_9RHOB